MAGEMILKAELEQIANQQTRGESYSVYIDDYANYGDWMDCSSYH